MFGLKGSVSNGLSVNRFKVNKIKTHKKPLRSYEIAQLKSLAFLPHALQRYGILFSVLYWAGLHR